MAIEHRTLEPARKSSAGAKTDKPKTEAKGGAPRAAAAKFFAFEVPGSGAEPLYVYLSYGPRPKKVTAPPGGVFYGSIMSGGHVVGPKEGNAAPRDEKQGGLAVADSKTERAYDDLTESEWEQAKAAALEILAADLDDPADHLAYVRARLARIRRAS